MTPSLLVSFIFSSMLSKSFRESSSRRAAGKRHTTSSQSYESDSQCPRPCPSSEAPRTFVARQVARWSLEHRSPWACCTRLCVAAACGTAFAERVHVASGTLVLQAHHAGACFAVVRREVVPGCLVLAVLKLAETLQHKWFVRCDELL